MNVYMLCDGNESISPLKFPFRIGLFSYIARDNRVFRDKNSSEISGDMMIISMNGAKEHITPAIFDECRKREYTSVFLDTDEPPTEKNTVVFSAVSESLNRRGLKTFCPIAFSDICPHSVPVADGAITGGVFKDELTALAKRHRKIGISLSRIISRFEMPAENAAGVSLSPKDLRILLNTFDSKVFFSPQLMTNYFLFSNSSESFGYVLCDTADTFSKKLRFAKESGFSDAFLIYREISDIAREIRI